MAEYYPLLAKAVANQKDSTPESRRALYERARTALLNQLRNAQPPVADADIKREEAALNAATARVEREVQAKFTDSLLAADEPRAAAPPLQTHASQAPVARRSPLPPPPPLRPPLRPIAGRVQASSPFARPPLVEPATAADAPSGAFDSPQVAANSLTPPVDAIGAPNVATERKSRPAAPGLELLRDFGRSKADSAPSSETVSENGLATRLERAESIRPLAPVARKSGNVDRRALIFGGALLAVMAVIFALAMSLREKPEDFARVAPPTEEQGDAAAAKIDGRIGIDGAPAKPSQSPSPPPAQPLAVAQRAALLVEAPDEASTVKTVVGTVIWSVETAPGGLPGLRAKVDIPGANFGVDLFLTKSVDPASASSHRVEVRFSVAPNDGVMPGVKQIAALEMRADDRPQGEPLTGVPQRITDNYYWFALAKGDGVVEHNLDLMRSRGWVDLPILLSTDRIAKIAIEKGAFGDRLMKQVLDAWAK